MQDADAGADAQDGGDGDGDDAAEDQAPEAEDEPAEEEPEEPEEESGACSVVVGCMSLQLLQGEL